MESGHRPQFRIARDFFCNCRLHRMTRTPAVLEKSGRGRCLRRRRWRKSWPDKNWLGRCKDKAFGWPRLMSGDVHRRRNEDRSRDQAGVAWQRVRGMLVGAALFTCKRDADDRNGAIRKGIGRGLGKGGTAGIERPMRKGDEDQRQHADEAHAEPPVEPCPSHQFPLSLHDTLHDGLRRCGNRRAADNRLNGGRKL